MLLVVSADYPPIPGGLTTVTRWALDVLSRRTQTALITYRPQGWLEVPPSAPCPVLRAPGFHSGAVRPWRMLRATQGWLRTQDVRVTRVLGLNLVDGGVVGRGLRRGHAVPYTLCAFGYDFLKWRRNALARRMTLAWYRDAERVIAISNFTRDALVEYGISRDKIDCCTFGFDVSRFTPGPPRPEFIQRHELTGKKLLLSVGRLVPRKGYDRVVEAVALLKARVPNLLYIIVGDGPMRDPLQQRIEALGLTRHVRLVGHVPDVDLPDWYRAARVLVQPNRREAASVEGLGLVFWEAGACGTPVIGGRSGGVVEAVEDGETGYLVDPDDVDALAGQLAVLCEDDALHARMGQHAAGRIRQRVAQAEAELPALLGLT